MDLNLDLNDVGHNPSSEKKKRFVLEHHEGDDYVLRIDNSTLEKFQTCPRAAEYYIVNRRQRPETAALSFGQAMHKALEIIGLHGNNPAAVQAARESLADHFVEKPPGIDEYRNLEYANEVLDGYLKKYSVESCSLRELNGKPAVEVPFALILGEMQLNTTLPYTHGDLTDREDKPADEKVKIRRLVIMWSGKIDRAVVFNQKNWVLDHKTSSVAGPTFYEDFYLNQAQIGYVWAARELFGELFAGSILDALVCRKKTRTGKGVEYERQFFFYEDWLLDEWKQDVMAEIETFVNNLCEGYFPKATKWCMGKYGKCPYHEVCTLPPSQRGAILNSALFVNVDWTPLAK